MLSSREARWAVGLAGIAVWAAAVPWLAAAVGLELPVPTRLEVVDHVVPGVAMLAGAAVLAGSPGLRPDLTWMGVGAVAFLTGVWITATHVPLVLDALDGLVAWEVALVHFSAGPPILLSGLWMLLIGQRSSGAPRGALDNDRAR